MEDRGVPIDITIWPGELFTLTWIRRFQLSLFLVSNEIQMDESVW